MDSPAAAASATAREIILEIVNHGGTEASASGKSVCPLFAVPNPQNTTAYNYDVDGNLTTLTDANSHTTLNGFDLLNQLNAVGYRKELSPSGA